MESRQEYFQLLKKAVDAENKFKQEYEDLTRSTNKNYSDELAKVTKSIETLQVMQKIKESISRLEPTNLVIELKKDLNDAYRQLEDFNRSVLVSFEDRIINQNMDNFRDKSNSLKQLNMNLELVAPLATHLSTLCTALEDPTVRPQLSGALMLIRRTVEGIDNILDEENKKIASSKSGTNVFFGIIIATSAIGVLGLLADIVLGILVLASVISLAAAAPYLLLGFFAMGIGIAVATGMTTLPKDPVKTYADHMINRVLNSMDRLYGFFSAKKTPSDESDNSSKLESKLNYQH